MTLKRTATMPEERRISPSYFHQSNSRSVTTEWTHPGGLGNLRWSALSFAYRILRQISAHRIQNSVCTFRRCFNCFSMFSISSSQSLKQPLIPLFEHPHVGLVDIGVFLFCTTRKYSIFNSKVFVSLNTLIYMQRLPAFHPTSARPIFDH